MPPPHVRIKSDAGKRNVNRQILQASTMNGAKVLDKEDEFGTITEGKMANLVLLDANPVEDLDNLAGCIVSSTKERSSIRIP
jgi:cytosine/adenosine deaminase-related metal-dependent hydrolase